MLTSSSNPKIKHVKSLGLRKFREKDKKFVIEGLHLVSEACAVYKTQKQFRIDLGLASEKVSRSKEGRALLNELVALGIETLVISDSVVKDLSNVETPQGIFAVVNEVEYGFQELIYSENPIVLACFEVQDPGNLGTMIRAAHAAGATGILVSKGTVEPYNEKVVRSSMGSIFHVPVVSTDDLEGSLKKLSKAGLKVIAADQKAGVNYWDSDLRGGVCFVLGSEGKGLSVSVQSACDGSVLIPMPGKPDSLNVAVSASLLLYEALRQRRK
jgi:TrmH family RNA methyltransferase